MSLTKAELKVTQLAADTAMQFSLLPVMHPADIEDVIFHVHAIQNIIMARSAQRTMPEEFPTYDDTNLPVKTFDETLMKCNLCIPPREMLGQYWNWHKHVEHGDHTELHLSREVYPDGSVGDIKREWCGGDGKCEKQCGGCARL